MKIKRKNLLRIIENYINEQPSLPTIVGIKGLQLKYLADLMKPYIKAKETADILDADKYFHYLAFYTAITEVGSKSESIKEDLIELGNAKELLDYLGSTTAVWRVGHKSSVEEWKDDMSSNLAGIEAGLKVLKGSSPGAALNTAYSRLSYTPKLDKIEIWKNKFGYAYWFEQRPDLYAEGKVYIQPQYNVKLSPDERKLAWKMWSEHNNEEIPDWVKDLKGPLQIF